jgi:hypothetical protein
VSLLAGGAPPGAASARCGASTGWRLRARPRSARCASAAQARWWPGGKNSDSGSMSTATVPSLYAFFRVMRTRPSGRCSRRSSGDRRAQHVAQQRLAPPRVQRPRTSGRVQAEPVERRARAACRRRARAARAAEGRSPTAARRLASGPRRRRRRGYSRDRQGRPNRRRPRRSAHATHRQQSPSVDRSDREATPRGGAERAGLLRELIGDKRRPPSGTRTGRLKARA